MEERTFAVSPFVEEKNRFNCVVLDLRKRCHFCEENSFEQIMIATIESWKADDVHAITTFIPSELSQRIPILLKLGFDFHHAKSGYVAMLKWIGESENTFPAYASHYIGVGGFVVNEKGEVLVIKERFILDSKWKYPGGGADEGEELEETARREVFEETGIESEFVGLLCYRHQHNFRYGCSDIYFGCLMKAKSTIIKKCDQEIEQCQWMKVSDLEKQNIFATDRFVLDSYLKYLETGNLIKRDSIRGFTHGNEFLGLAYTAGKVSAPVEMVEDNPQSNL